ncbi:hypothetical protein ACLOJK_036870 [Asimina triloba]
MGVVQVHHLTIHLGGVIVSHWMQPFETKIPFPLETKISFPLEDDGVPSHPPQPKSPKITVLLIFLVSDRSCSHLHPPHLARMSCSSSLIEAIFPHFADATSSPSSSHSLKRPNPAKGHSNPAEAHPNFGTAAHAAAQPHLPLPRRPIPLKTARPCSLISSLSHTARHRCSNEAILQTPLPLPRRPIAAPLKQLGLHKVGAGVSRSLEFMIEEVGGHYFQKQFNEKADYFYEIQVDQQNRLMSFIWADGDSKKDYQVFGDVTWLHAMGDVPPKAIITDQDPAITYERAVTKRREDEKMLIAIALIGPLSKGRQRKRFKSSLEKATTRTGRCREWRERVDDGVIFWWTINMLISSGEVYKAWTCEKAVRGENGRSLTLLAVSNTTVGVTNGDDKWTVFDGVAMGVDTTDGKVYDGGNGILHVAPYNSYLPFYHTCAQRIIMIYSFFLMSVISIFTLLHYIILTFVFIFTFILTFVFVFATMKGLLWFSLSFHVVVDIA